MSKLKGFLLIGVWATAALSFGGCGDGGKVKLYFDGGGGSGNYNSTISMAQSAANPYPYNTLEQLAKEWNRTQDKFEVVVNSGSLNGRRDAITSMLSAGTAPDMLYQVGGVVNDDIGKGWYIPLTDYLARVNPYVGGGQKWSELYNGKELSPAADGNYYYICLDKVLVGYLYNTEILNAAGVTKIPETYSEFFACMDALKAAKANGTIAAEAFAHQGFWGEIQLNTSVYGGKVGEWDLDGNSAVSSYELIKAYKEGKWRIDSPEFREYLRLCAKRASYYPDNYLAYDTALNFSRGKLAVTDGLGNHMRIAEKGLGSKLAVGGYPKLDAGVSPYGGHTVARGSAGLSTAYWVTNSASGKGNDAVEACVDFLMFLSAPRNNSRMVNDLGFALPIEVSGNTTELFAPLAEQYGEDSSSDETLMWSAVNVWGSFGQEFSDTYERSMGEFYQGKRDASWIVSTLESVFPDTVDKLAARYNWTF
ncbi:MAG: ABC transporter substrate-binding protein [Clostridiales bacterium]|jgi:ABC-type glycerol-3-phosphate transport system substrate-binding protein|nr:ABC transporter substrate-binding protein [Clostridiales bacterium]